MKQTIFLEELKSAVAALYSQYYRVATLIGLNKEKSKLFSVWMVKTYIIRHPKMLDSLRGIGVDLQTILKEVV